MKIILTFLLLAWTGGAMAQTTNTTQTKTSASAPKDTLPQRAYKVNMSDYNRDTTKQVPLHLLQPYQDKRLESNYQYEDGKVTGGSTKLKLNKKKNN